MSAEQIAKALGGRLNGDGWICRCPLPTHGKGRGDRNPSLSIKDGDGKLVVNCFGGCDPIHILDELRRRGLSAERDDQPLRRRSRGAPPSPATAPEPDPEPNPKALRLWLAAHPIAGTLGETYLREHRGITLAIPPSIRFSRAIYEKTGTELPCIIAAVQRADRRIIAVQATFLTERGAKAPITEPRWTYGALGTGAVRLAAATDVLGLAEGVETALSAMQLSGVPCWAALGAKRLANVSIHDAVQELHIFADSDEPGRIAAERAGDRHTRAGRRVILRFPPAGCSDYNDVLARRALVAA